MVKSGMKKRVKDVLIIGAGPAGMFCAMELMKDKNSKVHLIEKEKSIGGLAKTFEFREGEDLFRTDIGPHRFFSKNPYLYEVIEGLLKENWIAVNRKTRQFIEGKFYDYPVNALQAFKNLGVMRAIDMGISFVLAFMKYKILGKKITTFEDYIVANFGKSLGELNMLNYTEKIWGIPCNKIHPDWATQRIKGLNFISALENALLKKNKGGPKTLVDVFYYPKFGTGTIYSAIENEIRKAGAKIDNESFPVKISHLNGKMTNVEINVKGKIKNVKPDYLVESVPITDFIELLSPKPPREVIEAAKKLKWRNQVYLFITLNRKRITDDNWIYFPDRKIPFARVAEMKNFSAEMSPKDKTSVFVEFFVFENDKIWNMPKEELFDLTMNHFEKLGFFRRRDVRNYYLIKNKKVYPVYDVNYMKYLKIVKNYLDGFSNIIYAGRPGRFKYNNQDHSMEMGILAAKSIIRGKKEDIDRIGSEEEYFEAGKVKIKEDAKEKKTYNWLILEDRGTCNKNEE